MLTKMNHFKPASSITDPHLIIFFDYLGPISSYFYPMLQCLSAIPVFTTIIRYNLINTHIMKRKWAANIFAIVIPFIISIPLSHGNGFNQLLLWSGVILSSFINFILPIHFYYKSLLRSEKCWSRISATPHHKSLLERSNINLDRLIEIHDKMGQSRASLNDFMDLDLDKNEDVMICSEKINKCDIKDNKKEIKCKESESDGLLCSISKHMIYDNDLEEQISDFKSSFSIVSSKEFVFGHMTCKRNMTLCFFVFTVSLAFIAFILDILSVMDKDN